MLLWKTYKWNSVSVCGWCTKSHKICLGVTRFFQLFHIKENKMPCTSTSLWWSFACDVENREEDQRKRKQFAPMWGDSVLDLINLYEMLLSSVLRKQNWHVQEDCERVHLCEGEEGWRPNWDVLIPWHKHTHRLMNPWEIVKTGKDCLSIHIKIFMLIPVGRQSVWYQS